MGSWYVMWWCLTHMYQHLGGTWPSSELEGKNFHTLKRGQKVPAHCLGLSTKPHGVISRNYSEQTEVPITYHMPRFNVHEHQGC
jgi:hypothetical protein